MSAEASLISNTTETGHRPVSLSDFTALRPHYSTGRSTLTGHYESSRNGKSKPITHFREGMMTDLGDIEIEDWKKGCMN